MRNRLTLIGDGTGATLTVDGDGGKIGSDGVTVAGRAALEGTVLGSSKKVGLKGQVVIPGDIRHVLNIYPGSRVSSRLKDDILEVGNPSQDAVSRNISISIPETSYAIKYRLPLYLWTGFTGFTGYEATSASCKSCISCQNTMLYEVDT
jgi:AbrB family looped-hinge helix DNA binding protein